MTEISTNRRKVLAAALGCTAFLEQSGAWALSPHPPPEPTLEDHILKSDLVVMASIETFIFRSNDSLGNPEEYDRDFIRDSEKQDRDRDAILGVKKVFRSNGKVSNIKRVRVGRPFKKDDLSATLSSTAIYLLNVHRSLRNPRDGITKLMWCVIPPMPVEDEYKVRQALSTIRKRQTS